PTICVFYCNRRKLLMAQELLLSVFQVRYMHVEITEDPAFITAQIAGNEVVYAVVLRKVKKQKGERRTSEVDPRVPGNTEFERFDSGVRKVLTVSKEEFLKEDFKWKWKRRPQVNCFTFI